jgi:hypothetical protein
LTDVSISLLVQATRTTATVGGESEGRKGGGEEGRGGGSGAHSLASSPHLCVPTPSSSPPVCPSSLIRPLLPPPRPPPVCAPESIYLTRKQSANLDKRPNSPRPRKALYRSILAWGTKGSGEGRNEGSEGRQIKEGMEGSGKEGWKTGGKGGVAVQVKLKSRSNATVVGQGKLDFPRSSLAPSSPLVIKRGGVSKAMGLTDWNKFKLLVLVFSFQKTNSHCVRQSKGSLETISEKERGGRMEYLRACCASMLSATHCSWCQHLGFGLKDKRVHAAVINGGTTHANPGSPELESSLELSSPRNEGRGGGSLSHVVINATSVVPLSSSTSLPPLSSLSHFCGVGGRAP